MLDKVLEQYRRFYWIANGVLILAIAYVAAGMTARTALERLVPMPQPEPAAVAPVQKKQRPATMSDYQVILSRNLLDAKVEDAPEPAAVDPAALEDAPVKATIQATLMGTVSGPKAYAFAIVRAKNETEIVKIGEKIAGQAEVLEINRGAIVILNNGRKEELSMWEDKNLPGNQPPPRPARRASRDPEPAADPSEDISIRQTGENSYELDKSDFENMTQNLGPLLTQARVVPHFEGGTINGYKIFAIKPESLYMKIGLENGDVIHSINGIKVDSPEKALQMFQSLRTERNFTIDLSRNNTPLTFNYNLR